MRTSASADVAVVGAGAVGACVAVELARRGRRVAVVEARGLAAGATGASFGWVSAQFGNYIDSLPDYHVELLATAVRRYSSLPQAAQDRIGYRPWRALTIGYDNTKVAWLAAAERRLRSADLDAELWDRSAVLAAEPGLSDDSLAALKTSDAMVNPFLLVRSSIVEVAERGGFVVRGAPVRQIAAGPAGIKWLETEHTRIEAPIIVNAAGVGSPKIARLLDLDVPVQANKGEQLIALAAAALLGSLVNGHGHLGQPVPGHYIIGATRENALDDTVTLRSAAALAADAVRTVPALAGALVLRAFAGVRPVPADGLPILGPDRRQPGYFNAVLHGGMTLAPLVGELIARWIVDGTAPFIEHYGIERFQPGLTQ
jgi:glycine/D-amino acid oxidase-like deaminating enzyme